MAYSRQPQTSRRFCKKCNQHRLFERRSGETGGWELLLTLVTLGLYLVIKWVVKLFTNPWRCEKCGARFWFWNTD